MTPLIALLIVLFAFLAVIPIVQARFAAVSKVKELNELIKQNNFQEAKKVANNLPPRLRNTADVLFAQYLINAKQNNYRMALYYLDEIERRSAYDERLNITEDSVNLMKTDIFESMGDQDEVARTCRKIIKNDTKNLSAHEKLALYLFERKNYDEALIYLERCEKLNSENFIVYQAYAELLSKKGKNDQALKMIEKAIRIYKGKNCRLMEMRVIFLYRNHQPRVALEYANEIDTIYKKSVETKAVIGLCLYETGNTKEALRAFDSILEKHLSITSPEITKARLVYSTLLLEEKKLDNAISQLDMIDRAGSANNTTTEMRKVLEILLDDEALKDIFINNRINVLQKIITDSIDWKKFLQEFHKSPNEKNDILLLRETNATDRNFSLFWFYFKPAIITPREASSMYLEIENLISSKQKDADINYCALFRPSESTIKILAGHPRKINFICGEDLLFRLKSRKIA